MKAVNYLTGLLLEGIIQRAAAMVMKTIVEVVQVYVNFKHSIIPLFHIFCLIDVCE